MRDSQKQRVYDWEDKVISPKDNSRVPFNQIQSIVNYIWGSEGLQYPPKVKAFPNNVKTKCGDATRLALRFHECDSTPTWVIIHEMAHALTSDHYGNSNRHGSEFVGIYIELISKYLNIPLFELTYSARKSGVKFKLGAVAFETVV